jgi:transcriptional regulator GlxA family with amidase domain
VVFQGSELLDVSGPWEVLSHANELLGYEAYALELVTLAAGEVRTRHGLVLGGARSLRALERRGLPDLLLIAGGSPLLPMPEDERRFARWLAQHHAQIPMLVSICTGAFVLGEAGLLDGRRVTTHWRFIAELRRRFPRARVVDDGIFEQSDRVWTSAGITAGIDLCLALVEQAHGRASAMAVAKNLVLFLRRSGAQAQFSEALRRQEREPEPLRDISTFVLEHLHEPLPVERVARAMGMSVRSLGRACHGALGESPAVLVRRLRLEQARRLLEESTLPLKAVARQTGLGDASTLWRLFTRQLGVTPAEYRERFASALEGPS